MAAALANPEDDDEEEKDNASQSGVSLNSRHSGSVSLRSGGLHALEEDRGAVHAGAESESREELEDEESKGSTQAGGSAASRGSRQSSYR